MKKRIFFYLFSILITSFAFGQQEYSITFGYDSAGNQTLRDRVCINCGSGAKVADSTIVADIEELEDIVGELDPQEPTTASIVAYPNPATDILKVEWVTTNNAVKEIVLFSSIGQQIGRFDTKTAQRSLDLSFSSQPPGLYIVIVLFEDNTKKSFQVLKN